MNCRPASPGFQLMSTIFFISFTRRRLRSVIVGHCRHCIRGHSRTVMYRRRCIHSRRQTERDPVRQVADCLLPQPKLRTSRRRACRGESVRK